MKVSFPEKGEKKKDLKFKNSFGRYLISNFNTWHGGVHIENPKSEIFAIADGRIIGYRIQNEYIFEEETTSKVSTKPSNTSENNTSESSTAETKKKGYNYSNSFMLLQHDVLLSSITKKKDAEGNDTESVEQKYVTFYSLYNHLMPVSELETMSKLPNFLKKEEVAITASHKLGNEVSYKGLNARIAVGNKIKYTSSYKYTIKAVIPNGEIVDMSLDDNHKPVTIGNWVRIKYNGREDIYISTSQWRNKERVQKIGETQYQILVEEDTGTSVDQTGIAEDKKNKVGAKVYETKSKTGVVNDIIPKDNSITIKEKDGDWYVIDGVEGFCHKDDFKVTESIDSSKVGEEIIACDIPVKAGNLIGYTGAYQHPGRKSYATCQLDVFMATEKEAEDFIHNCFGAGKEEDKKFLSFPASTPIKKILEIEVDLKKDTLVQVLEVRNDIYTKVKLTTKTKPKQEKLSAVFQTSFLRDNKNMKYSDSGGAHYTIVDKSLFPKINALYNNKLPDANVKLKWGSRCDKNGIPLPGNITARRKKEKDLLAANKKSYRSLTYLPVPKKDPINDTVPKEFWIEIKHLDEKAVYKTVHTRIDKPRSIGSSPTFNDYISSYENQIQQLIYDTTQIEWLNPEDNVIPKVNLKKKYIVEL